MHEWRNYLLANVEDDNENDAGNDSYDATLGDIENNNTGDYSFTTITECINNYYTASNSGPTTAPNVNDDCT